MNRGRFLRSCARYGRRRLAARGDLALIQPLCADRRKKKTDPAAWAGSAFLETHNLRETCAKGILRMKIAEGNTCLAI